MKIFKVLLSDSDYDDFISAVMVAKDEDTIREHEDEFHQGFLPWDESNKAKMSIAGVAFRMNSYQSFKSIEEIGTYTGKELPKGKKIGVILANTRKA
jgi:hypothetical protein